MPRTVTYSCKVCGTAKQDANHWFVCTNTKIGFHLNTWEWAVREELLDDDGTDYLCGHQCIHKLLDRFLDSTVEQVSEKGE
jgi:hypothetical protein